MTIVGATYHQMGKPRYTTSYSAIDAHFSAMAGRDEASFISSVLRERLSIQSRSAAVYGTAGFISNISAPTASATACAAFAVVPVGEKYATSFLLILPTSDIL